MGIQVAHLHTHRHTDKPLEGAVLIVDRRSSLGQSLWSLGGEVCSVSIGHGGCGGRTL